MKSIYTNIKINNENVKRNKRKIRKEDQPQHFWATVFHIFLTGLLALLGVLLGIQLIFFLFLSSYFSLAKVEVGPMKQIEKTEILDLANVKLNSNLLSLRTGNIIKRVTTHPWVEEVQIQKRFPDTLRIEVNERRPVAVVCGKDMFGIDIDGHLLPGIRMDELKELPMITVNENQLAGLPDRVNSIEMQNALSVIKYLKANYPLFLKEVSEFNITVPDNLVIYTLHEGTEIRLGKENLEERLEKLQQVWQIVKQQQLVEEYIDLRFDKQGVVTKPKSKNRKQSPTLSNDGLRT